jgi:hypothetical protein
MTRPAIVGGAITAIGLVIALGATLGPLPPSGTDPGASLTVRLPEAVKVIVLVLLALSILILLAMLRRPPRREEEPSREQQRLPAWAGPLASLPAVLALLVLWYLIRERWAGPDGEVTEGPFAAISGLLDALAAARKAPTSIPFFDVAVAVLAVLLALGVFTLMVLVALAEPLAKWRAGRAGDDAAGPVHEAVTESLEDLRSVPDARAAILRVYRHFERALSDARAPRAPWQTPSEFMRAALARLPVPLVAVERLTALFEIARFSDRPLGIEARDAACDYLDEIRTALEGEAAHAA